MGKIFTGRDYSLYSVVVMSGPLISEKLIVECVSRIEDPYIVKMAIAVRLSQLEKSGVNELELRSIRNSYAELLKNKRKEWKKFLAQEKKRNAEEERMKCIKNLALGCMDFVDKNESSKILSKGGNPAVQWLGMSYRRDGIYISFHFEQYARLNGILRVRVRIGRKTVFDYSGPAMGYEGQEVKTYIPGDWEKKFIS